MQNTNIWISPPPQLSIFRHPLTGMMSLILYKCFRYKRQRYFQLTNVFSRLISLTFLYCCSTTSVDSFESNLKNQLLLQHDFSWNLAFMFISNHLICWFAVKNYAKGSFSRLKCLWSMFGKWFLNTCVNHAIFARSRRLIWRMLRQIFPAARKCLIEIEPHSEEQ